MPVRRTSLSLIAFRPRQAAHNLMDYENPQVYQEVALLDFQKVNIDEIQHIGELKV